MKTTRWQWKGRRLAAPHVILRRLAAWPVFQAGRLLMCAGAALGWGPGVAWDTWKQTS